MCRDRIWRNVATTLDSLPPSSRLTHLGLTLVAPPAPRIGVTRHRVQVSRENWDPVIQALKRLDTLACVDLTILPFSPWDPTDGGIYDRGILAFFTKPVDELFPPTRCYTVRVIFADDPS